MKVELKKDRVVFIPVKITLETQGDIEKFYAILDLATDILSGDSDAYNFLYDLYDDFRNATKISWDSGEVKKHYKDLEDSLGKQ